MTEHMQPHEWDNNTLEGIDWVDPERTYVNNYPTVAHPGSLDHFNAIRRWGQSNDEWGGWGRNKVEDPLKDVRKITGGDDYLGGIDWGKFRPGVESEPDDRNAKDTFLNRINPLLDRIRNRPLGNGYSIGHSGLESEGSEHVTSVLKYDGQHVGQVTFSAADDDDGNPAGHVHGLSIRDGHQHMTMKLLQEAHDFIRHANQAYGTTHFQGPNASNEINEHSGPIVAKYNRESEDFSHSDYARGRGYSEYVGRRYDDDEDEEDDESRWERLSDEAANNHDHYAGAPCHTCGGAGESLLVPSNTNNRTQQTPTTYDFYRARQERPYLGEGLPYGVSQQVAGVTLVEQARNTEYADDSEGNEHEFDYEHPRTGKVYPDFYPQAHGYTPTPYTMYTHHRDSEGNVVYDQIQTQAWTKPCPDCGHLSHPGFPDHEDNI